MSATAAQGADGSTQLQFLQRLPCLSEASNPVPQLEQQTGISSTRVNPKNLRLAAKVRNTKTVGDNKKRRQAGNKREEEGGVGGRGLMGCGYAEKSWRDKEGGCDRV